jgi:hypothetical protein
MEELATYFEKINVNVDTSWKINLENDLTILSRHYTNQLFDNIGFLPYEDYDEITKHSLINYLTQNNQARSLLSNKIKELYPNEFINVHDVDSIMDYYIHSLMLME